MQAPSYSRVRGAAYISAREFVVDRFGIAALARVLESLPPDQRATIERTVDRLAWEPFPVWTAFVEATDRVLGAGDLALARQGGSWAAQRDLPVAFPELAHQGTPKDIVELASRFWSFYYDGGRAEAVVMEYEPVTFVFEVIGFPSPSAVHCQRVLGWIGGAFALIGMPVAMEMPSCRAQGGERCLFVIRAAGDGDPQAGR